MKIIFVFLTLYSLISVAEKYQYFSTEHPKVIYINQKYFSYANLTAQRYGRNDPFYYVGLHFISLFSLSDNVTVNLYFYEWLTNVYKPSFVEMHFTLCNFINNESLFGIAMKQGKLDQPCPYPAGVYNLYNMTVPVRYIHRSHTQLMVYDTNFAYNNNSPAGAGDEVKFRACYWSSIPLT